VLLAEVAPIASQVTEVVRNKVVLNCGMTRYLRPDDQFLWKKGSDMITNGSRFTIQYRNLDSDSAGQLTTARSTRISSLIISDSQLSDSGNYTCFVSNTNAMGEVSLLITDSPTPDSTGRQFLKIRIHF